ncbi:MAG: hypothetical protein EG823_05250 [Actinobacteria bacterium]|nr:hypothetical protein [Actinomycetota bacterium]
MPATFGFVPVMPPFAGAGQEEAVVAQYMARLRSQRGTRWGADDLDGAGPLVYVIATGGTEGALLALHDERQAHAPGEPALLLTHPGNNSLPAALEVLARLQQDGAQGRIVYLRGVEDDAGWHALSDALHDVRVRAELRTMRIGLVGAPSDWLVASSPDPAVVSEVWGPEVVEVSLEDLTAAIDSAAPEDVALAAAAFAADAAETVEPSDDDITDVARVYVGMRALVAARGLDALTVRCFDLVLNRSTSGCFALSKLIDDGVVAGCEGDLVSTIGMVWARLLTSQTPWMANPADVDVDANSVLLAHCTVPRTIVESYSLRSHFESGLGVGIQGTLPLGPVTLLRIGGTMLDALWLAEGEITATGTAANLCRTQARIALSSGNVRDLLSAPLGNHIVMVYGHHAERLASWWESML